MNGVFVNDTKIEGKITFSNTAIASCFAFDLL